MLEAKRCFMLVFMLLLTINQVQLRCTVTNTKTVRYVYHTASIEYLTETVTETKPAKTYTVTVDAPAVTVTVESPSGSSGVVTETVYVTESLGQVATITEAGNVAYSATTVTVTSGTYTSVIHLETSDSPRPYKLLSFIQLTALMTVSSLIFISI